MENAIPSGVAILFFIDIAKGKTYKNGSRSEITSKIEITSRSPLRFLENCAGKNLISARSLYPFDDLIDQTIGISPDEIPFSSGSGNQKVGRTLLLLLELPPLENFFSPGSGDSLRGRKILGY